LTATFTVDDLATTLARRTAEGNEKVAQALRELIAAVMVHPASRAIPPDPRLRDAWRSLPRA
jgi:hypothetical protein